MINELRELGLENYEAKALEILFKERVSLRELSKKAGVPFGKIYSVVKELKKKGFVKETNSRPKLVYVENASEVVWGLIKSRQEGEKLKLERLRNQVSNIDKDRDRKSRFFQIGILREERKDIQLRSFREAEEEVLQILNIYHKPIINRQSKSVYEKEIKNAIMRGVIFKAIYPLGVELPQILNKLNRKYPERFQVKRFNTDFIRCDIIDSKKVLIKLAQKDVINSGGSIFVENEALAENLKNIFEEMWNRG